MALRVNAQQYGQKWASNLKASSGYIKEGVNRVKTAPGEQAAAAAELMLARLTEAVTSGLWAKKVAAVSLQDWQSAMINKGIGRIAAGADQAVKTKQQTWANLLSAVESAQAAANAIPKGDINASIQRAAAYMTAMHNQKNAIRGA